MRQNEKHESSSSDLRSIVIVESPDPTQGKQDKAGKGFYADNLAFEHDELISRSAGDVYHQLSESDTSNKGSVTVITPSIDRWLFWRAIISGCLLAATIILFYLWIHIKYINPLVIEIFHTNPDSPRIPFPETRPLLMPPFANNDDYDIADKTDLKTTWLVDYDLPDGVPLLKLNVTEMSTITTDTITCPSQKFALVLYLDSDAKLAETWLEICSPNIAYFRVDGDPSADDIERLLKYLTDTNANYIPLKAALNIEKGGNILDNENFLSTINSDEIITNVAISGYITPKTIEELIQAVPSAEDLTIEGDEICSSLKRSRQEYKECQVSWTALSNLHIIETGNCLGMFDLIYSCWDMPNLETLQIRRSNINDANANYIKSILDKYRITRVDFADNVCFDNTLVDYPFMCQPSG